MDAIGNSSMGLDWGALRVAFGCEQLGGHAWGDVSQVDVERALHVALDRGIRVFDTADCYGKGESETRLGRFLRGRRSEVFVSTKFGVRFDSSGRVFYDASPEWAEAALAESLRRLGTDCIDLLQLHYPDGLTPLDAVAETLRRFRDEGKIRAFGISNQSSDIVRLVRQLGFSSFSLEYSLANRRHEKAGQLAKSTGAAFLGYGALGQGVLSGKYRGADGLAGGDRRTRAAYVNFHGDRLARNLAIVDALRRWSARVGAPVPVLAISWILRALPGSVALVGIKNPLQAEQAAAAATLNPPDEFFADLESLSRESDLG